MWSRRNSIYNGCFDLDIGTKWLLLIPLVLCLCCSQKEITNRVSVFRYNESKGIATLDPAYARYQALVWPVSQLYNGLLELSDSLAIVPSLARRWNVSKDGTAYTFQLRTDVFFHDDSAFTAGKGRKLTAYDVEYSLCRLTDPSVASPGSWTWNEVYQNKTGTNRGIKVLNDSTLVIYLKRPFPPFAGILATPYCYIVPREAVEKYGRDFRSHPVGTGPFRLKAWYEGEKLILVRNEKYFEKDASGRALPYLDAVAISFIPDKQSEFLEFLKGNLDFISGVNAAFKDELITRSGRLNPKYAGKIVLETGPYLNTEYIGFLTDTTLPQVKNSAVRYKLVRQALNYGFDRVKMIRYLRNGMGTPALHGFVPVGLPSFTDTLKGYFYDPEKARELLKKAGFPEGKGLPPVTILTTGDYVDLIEFIQHETAALGIQIRIEVANGPVFRESVSNARAASFRGSWVADYPDAENYLALFYSRNFSPAGPNYFHFRNAEFDRLYEQAAVTNDEAARFALYRKMDRIIIDEAPVIPLFYDRVVRFVHSGISGMDSNPMNVLVLKKVAKYQ
ncbi:MAG TPA: ABC transporter substrate-binding protein [Bacteroidales bacterium]|nr:ABC transporter substrate-binding protein [Bacteroidales bacterium]